MAYRRFRIIVCGLFFVWIVGACSNRTNSPPQSMDDQTGTPTGLIVSATAADQPATQLPSTEIPNRITPTEVSRASCAIGLGLRRETVDILLDFKDHPGFVMSANMQLAETYFPELEGWTRTLGAPSLEDLEARAMRALDAGLEYEALSYGLETSATTPQEEWSNLVASAEQARILAESFDKQLALGPGFRLMAENEHSYAPMAALTQIWMIQTQRLQINPPGQVYRQEVERIVNMIRSGNPEIEIWAQITFLPDRPPNAEEWLAYREAIFDLVDGTFIGVYTWDSESPEVLKETIRLIFETACQ